MAEFPETNDSLIVRVQDPSNRAAWEQFEELYRPVIYRIARAKGMQNADALDLVQQVLLSVSAAIDRFEKQADGGRFRNWLSRVTRNAILKALTRAPRDRAAGGTSVLNVLSEVSADDETDALIQLEYRRELFRQAAQHVRCDVQESTWLAFELTTVQQLSVERAADLIGISIGSVYAARSRVMRRIRDAVNRLQQNSLESEEST